MKSERYTYLELESNFFSEYHNGINLMKKIKHRSGVQLCKLIELKQSIEQENMDQQKGTIYGMILSIGKSIS